MSDQVVALILFGITGFYDEVGALRDVVQNHLLQMVSLLAMEPPVSQHPDALRDELVKVLRATSGLKPERIVRGQHQGFLDEEGVAAGSDTETFAAVGLEIDSWRSADVPWIIRGGKGLAKTVTEAVVEFRRPPRPLFTDTRERPGPNRLRFRTKPGNRFVMEMQAKAPRCRPVSTPVGLAHDHPDGARGGNGRLPTTVGGRTSGDLDALRP